MSTLTGQQIKNTYQGLLKLENSSSGITQNLQNIQDGLGGDTGLRISTTQLESHNNIAYKPFKAQYYGAGFNPGAGAQFAANTQNVILTSPFYDNGNYAYSAITINVVTQTSTNDTLEFAIYNSQIINPFGLFPYQPLVSGLTADTTTLGLKNYYITNNPINVW